MTAILVSGGAGYVGSHIAKALRNAGHDPVVFDNLSTGHPHFVKWGPLVEADIKDAGAVADAVRQYGIQAVVHCAADADAGQSSIFPQRCYETNVAGTLSLLKGMLDAACTKLVFSSSCAIYGDPHSTRPFEKTPRRSRPAPTARQN